MVTGMARWGFRRAENVERASTGPSFPLGQAQTLAEFLGLNVRTSAGVVVTEATAMGSTALYRCVSILANTVAGMPLKTYRTVPVVSDESGTTGSETRTEVPSIFDNPCNPWYTPYEWKHIVVVHGALHGEAFLKHIYDDSRRLVALFPIHPAFVSVRWVNGDREYTITVPGQEKQVLTSADITHIMFGPSVDGLRGMSPIFVARNAIGTGLAGDEAAGKMFANGLFMGGVLSVPDATEAQAQEIKTGLKSSLSGAMNAGDIAVINAAMTLSPWTMNSHDAQFIESRQFQVEEIARLYGVPKVLLAEDGASTWGAGIAQLDQGMAKYTFPGYTNPIEDRLSALLAAPRHVEFEYKELLRGTPADEIALLIQQKDAGILTVNEVRGVLNLPPLTPVQIAEAAPVAPPTKETLPSRPARDNTTEGQAT
jgi:HK97 family phage portal protein